MGYQIVTCPMTTRDPEGAVRQYGRLSQPQLGCFLLFAFARNKSMARSVLTFVNFGCKSLTHLVYFRHIMRSTYDKITYAYRYIRYWKNNVRAIFTYGRTFGNICRQQTETPICRSWTTSLSPPLSRTLAPVHLLWRVLRPGINCRCTYEHGSQLAPSRRH